MIAAPVSCVVDASVGIKLVIAETGSSEAHALFAHLASDPAARFFTPELFDLECASVLCKHVQQAGLALADAQRHLSFLGALAIQRWSVTTLAADALTLAANHRITVYDATYLAVAQRLAVPLITADARLVARTAGGPYRVLELGAFAIPAPRP